MTSFGCRNCSRLTDEVTLLKIRNRMLEQQEIDRLRAENQPLVRVVCLQPKDDESEQHDGEEHA